MWTVARRIYVRKKSPEKCTLENANFNDSTLNGAYTRFCVTCRIFHLGQIVPKDECFWYFQRSFGSVRNITLMVATLSTGKLPY